MATLRLALQDIALDTRLQPRARIDDDQVRVYAERMKEGDTFPPIVIYHDGATYWLADGFHRFYAARENGDTGIRADVRSGSFRDAVLHSTGANAQHGVPRSRADTRRAIEVLLKDEEWVKWSDREISRKVGCGNSLVSRVRGELEASVTITQIDERTVSRNGTTYQQAPRQPDEYEEHTPVRITTTTLPYTAPIIVPEPTTIIVSEPKPTVTPGGVTLETWNTLTTDEQSSILARQFAPNDTQFNKQDQDHIEWARWSWNPITGCKHTCIYCYARDIADRFYPQGFTPTLMPDRLAIPYAHQPPESGGAGYKNVFTCSMADLWGRWVPQEWINAVLTAVSDNPQWNFLMLTKFPARMAEQDWPDNAWVGTSVDSQARVDAAEKAFSKVKAGVKWLSCEPLLEPLKFSSLAMFDWIVIGGQSRSTQAPEFQPKWEWIEDLLWQARQAGCKVYFKTNLLNRPREYPE